jgi:hypothetical protein
MATPELKYELQFRRGAKSITVKLHIDCWERWRAKRLHASSSVEEGIDDAPTHPVYLCTRHHDGRVVCNVYSGLEVALDALHTFSMTARYFGYQVHASEAEELHTHLARNAYGSLLFWISERDESTLGWAELAL